MRAGLFAALTCAALSSMAQAQTMVLTLDGAVSGEVSIELFADVAPAHAERMVALTEAGAYDGVAFHRVIANFMAQTGDVEHARCDAYSPRRAGTGSSDLPDLPLEPSAISFEPGVVGMARSQNPNSGNSQFFIMRATAPHLNGQYTVFGQVRNGLDLIQAIPPGDGRNGAVSSPVCIVDARIE